MDFLLDWEGLFFFTLESSEHEGAEQPVNLCYHFFLLSFVIFLLVSQGKKLGEFFRRFEELWH